MMPKVTGGWGPFALAVVTWLALSACARATPEEPAAAASSALSARPAPPALDPRTVGWDEDQWYAYELALSTAVSFGDGPKVFDFDLSGLVQIEPAAVTPEVVTLYVALADAKIVSRVPRSQADLDRVATELQSTGCFFTLSGGRVTEMRAPRGFSAIAANTYREIGASLQFARPTALADRYTAEEYDTTGQYVAEYTFDRDQSVWHKRKVRYIAILAAKTAPQNAPGHVVPQIDGSEGTVRLFANGRPQSINLRNTVALNGAQQPIHATTSLTLQAGPAQPAKQPGPDWGALMAAMPRTGADEPWGGGAAIESLDSARIKGMTFEKAVAELERMAKERGGVVLSSVNGAPLDPDEQAKRERQTEGESGVFIALAAILREQPQTIPLAIKRIQAKSPAATTLISALSSASTPATQSALVELANAKTTDPATRTQVLAALSRTPRPDAKSIDAMKALLKTDPFNEQGLLSLGTYSRRLRDAGSVDEANELGALLVERLKAAKFVSDRLTALRAITNSGYAPALPYVTPFLTHGEPVVRSVAVRALQSMHDPKVDGIIAERLASDAASDVRISALGAAKVREPTDVLAHAVENAATSAEDPHVRYRAVELLASWVASRPDVRPTLERVAKNDLEVRIRDRAQGAL